MFKESVRYFNGESLNEYSNDQEEVEYISYKEDKQVVVAFKDGTTLKIRSPFMEYKSKWIHDESDELPGFGW